MEVVRKSSQRQLHNPARVRFPASLVGKAENGTLGAMFFLGLTSIRHARGVQSLCWALVGDS